MKKRNSLSRKGFCCIFIIFFIVACFIPSIYGNFETNNQEKFRFNPFSYEKIDQQQPLWNGSGIGCAAPHMLAQSFKPTLNTLTKVELLVHNWDNATGNLVISIRKFLTFELTSVSVPVQDFPQNMTWIKFDFPDIYVSPEKTYYIVWTPTSPDWQKCTFWGSFGSNKVTNEYDNYHRGSAWSYSSQGGWSNWGRPNSNGADYCFKTYGQDDFRLDVNIQSGRGVRFVTKNMGDTSVYNVTYSISVKGGIFKLINESLNGFIHDIPAGESYTETIPTFGLGSIKITATVNFVTIVRYGFTFGGFHVLLI